MDNNSINMTSPAVIREYMEKSDFFFKKKLGQNFLKDEHTARKIADTLELSREDTVFEIGPGFGALTQYLINDAKRVVALEIDPFAVKVLNEVFSDSDNLTVVKGDILKADIPYLTGEAEHLKTISNLPYYITSPVIMKLLTCGVRFEKITVMVQKEMAQRMGARVGSKDYSSFTAALDYYAEVNVLFSVPRTVFLPSPNVDSTVCEIVPRQQPKITVKNEDIFFKVIKSGFAMRRKTMENCIAAGFSLSKQESASLLNAAGIAPTARAETLTLEAFGALADVIAEK